MGSTSFTLETLQSRCLGWDLSLSPLVFSALPAFPRCVPELGTAHRTGKELEFKPEPRMPEGVLSRQDLCSWKSRAAPAPALVGDGTKGGHCQEFPGLVDQPRIAKCSQIPFPLGE